MKKQEGFTLIELMVVILIIGILVAIAVPVFFSAQSNAEIGACQDNLRTLDGAVMQYAAGNRGLYPTAIADLEGDYVREIPMCGTFNYTLVGADEQTRAQCGSGDAAHTY